MPDDSLRFEPPIEVVRPRERAGLQVEQLDAGLGNPAEVQVDHGRPVDRLDVVGDRLVRPRAARHDHDFVKVPAKHFDRRAMMPARRVEASPIDGECSVHEGTGGWQVWVVKRSIGCSTTLSRYLTIIFPPSEMPDQTFRAPRRRRRSRGPAGRSRAHRPDEHRRGAQYPGGLAEFSGLERQQALFICGRALARRRARQPGRARTARSGRRC